MRKKKSAVYICFGIIQFQEPTGGLGTYPLWVRGRLPYFFTGEKTITFWKTLADIVGWHDLTWPFLPSRKPGKKRLLLPNFVGEPVGRIGLGMCGGSTHLLFSMVAHAPGLRHCLPSV